MKKRLQGQKVDALVLKDDEGRGVAAKSFGEVCSNLWSENLRMGEPGRSYILSSINRKVYRESPGEVKHLSTQRKRKQIFIFYCELSLSCEACNKIIKSIPLVVANEKGGAQTYCFLQ